jgi:hypothetical protein
LVRRIVKTLVPYSVYQMFQFKELEAIALAIQTGEIQTNRYICN